MRKIVRFRKVCDHYEVPICEDWRRVLAEYGLTEYLDE